MEALHRDKGFEKMNTYGKQNIPFLAIIDYKMEKILLSPLDKISPTVCTYQFPHLTNTNDSNNYKTPKLIIKELSKKTYQQSFNTVLNHINNGDSYLCNLSCEIPIENKLNFEELFHSGHSKYKLRYKNEFVCFSPEIFIQIKENTIRTFPMKGTIDAQIDKAEQKLLDDSKELAEHYTITDLLRNDLSKISSGVRVEKFRYVDELTTNKGKLLQTSSIVRGVCKNNWQQHIGDILERILPAGSITGAPKKKTCEIIDKAETHKRGFYTGVCCLFDGTNLDSFVMIRMFTQKDGKYYYKAGGGITSFSLMEKEYNEVIQKIYVPIS